MRKYPIRSLPWREVKSCEKETLSKTGLAGNPKNGKIYFPYLAACIFVVMVYYLIGFLSSDPVIREMEGGAQMQIILSLGTGVMGIFP